MSIAQPYETSTTGTLTRTGRAVLACLRSVGTTPISVPDIAGLVGCSTRQVSRSLATLQAQSLIATSTTRGGHAARSYVVTVSPLANEPSAAHAPSTPHDLAAELDRLRQYVAELENTVRALLDAVRLPAPDMPNRDDKPAPDMPNRDDKPAGRQPDMPKSHDGLSSLTAGLDSLACLVERGIIGRAAQANAEHADQSAANDRRAHDHARAVVVVGDSDSNDHQQQQPSNTPAGESCLVGNQLAVYRMLRDEYGVQSDRKRRAVALSNAPVEHVRETIARYYRAGWAIGHVLDDIIADPPMDAPHQQPPASGRPNNPRQPQRRPRTKYTYIGG